MTALRQTTGALGEATAANHLLGLGWAIVERNARTRYGEIDLIGLDRGALVFVEVKALRGGGAAAASRALESIGPRKRLQVRRLARAWISERRTGRAYSSIRFDAIGVAVSPPGRAAAIEHVRAAF